MIQLFVQLYRDYSNSFKLSKTGEFYQVQFLGPHSSLERKKNCCHALTTSLKSRVRKLHVKEKEKKERKEKGSKTCHARIE